MKNLCAILFLFYFAQAQAQYNPENVNKKAVKWYLKSQDQARDDRFEDGIKSLQEAVRIDDRYEDAWLSMAGMYGELKNYSASVESYKKAKAIDSVYFIDFNLFIYLFF